MKKSKNIEARQNVTGSFFKKKCTPLLLDGQKEPFAGIFQNRYSSEFRNIH